MSNWNKNNTAFIMVSGGYGKTRLENEGFKVYSPYYGDDLPLRLLREICFRVPFFPKNIWYRKEIISKPYNFIIIYDVNITSYYLEWLQKTFPEAIIVFLYNNMVGKARNIKPSRIPKGIKIWTYDDYDAKKYGINLQNHDWIDDSLIEPPTKEKSIDVFFVGRDKGRGDLLIRLEKQFNAMGLKTKFIITKDKKYSFNKLYYQKPISYRLVLDYIARSKAVLNIPLVNQEGITLRDMESVAMGIKLITTNKNIVNKDIYDKRNVFILGVDLVDNLPSFLQSDTVNIIDSIRDKHSFAAMMDEITS